MISLQSDFAEPADGEAHWPVPPQDLEFWHDVFSALLPPAESDEVSSEWDGDFNFEGPKIA
jgi:hypothetical protein